MPNDLYRSNHPGSSGNYIDTDDVNLLDADTAHIHQSIGEHISSNSSLALSTDYPLFGVNSLKATANGAGKRMSRSSSGTNGFPISPSTEYTLSVDARTTIVNRETAAGITWYDSGGTYISASTQVYLSASDAWGRLSITVVSPASAAFCSVNGYMQTDAAGNPSSGDVVYFGKFCLVEGSGATFIPSIRIVGDSDMRAKIGLTDYTAAAAQALLDTLTSNKGHRLAITTGGEIEARMGDGAADNTGTSSGAAFTNGTPYEIKATQDISTGLWQFYKDDVNFDDDALGAAITPSAAANAMSIGADVAGTALLATGDIYWIEDRDGIDGPIVRKYDAQLAFEAA